MVGDNLIIHHLRPLLINLERFFVKTPLSIFGQLTFSSIFCLSGRISNILGISFASRIAMLIMSLVLYLLIAYCSPGLRNPILLTHPPYLKEYRNVLKI